MEGVSIPTVFHIKGWCIRKHQDMSYALLDGHGKVARVRDIPDDLFPQMQAGSMLIGIDIHVKVEPSYTTDFFAWGGKIIDLYYYVPKRNPCDCGAVYTSFPEHHSTWCSSSEWT